LVKLGSFIYTERDIAEFKCPPEKGRVNKIAEKRQNRNIWSLKSDADLAPTIPIAKIAVPMNSDVKFDRYFLNTLAKFF